MALLDWQGWLDRQLQGMGYTKAAGGPQIATLFQGEAPAYSSLFAGFKEADWERLAVASSWIYSDISLLASTFSGAQAQVKKRAGDELRDMGGHQFEALLAKPNPHMGRSHLWRYTLWWLLLRGEAYWWNVPSVSGELAQLWPIPADRIWPIPDKQTYISGYAYRYRDGTETETLPASTVTYFRLPNPFDYHRGMSPLTACRLGLQTDHASQQWNLNVVEKGAPLKMLVSVPDDLPPDAFNRFKADIQEQFSAGMQYLVGRAGSIEAKAMGLAPADLEFIAGRTFTREEIDRVYGIPAGFWAKEATRANSEAADNVLIEKTVMPLHVLCAEQVTAQTLAHYDDPDLCVEFEDIRKEDRKIVVEERRQNWQVYTVDEARAELGMAKYPDSILGGTLVPLATKQQAPGGFSEPSPVPVEEVAEIMEFKTDLRKWKSLALRRLGEGQGLDYDFLSDVIPEAVRAGIKGALLTAGTEEEVRAAFDYASLSGRTTGHWSVYP